MMKNVCNFKPRTVPFPHQEDAIRFIIEHKDVAIFDEQGLGKTKVVIDSLANEIREKRIKSALIICKKSLMRNWQEEIETHSNLKSIIIDETKVRRGNLFTFPSHFMIIGYETARSELRTLKQLLSIKAMAVVLDESHKIKNQASKITHALHEIAPLAKQRIILSGTPVANTPEDLWAQFYFLDLGILLGDEFESFKKQFGNLKGRTLTSSQKLALDELREIIKKRSIRRLKDDVLELPSKTYQNLCVTLSKEQQKIYDTLREELLVEITGMEEEQVMDETQNILKKLLRLTQIASNPYLINKKYSETPAKYVELDKLVDDVVGRGEKVIIWTSFVENISLLKKRYKKHKAVTIYGRLTVEERNESVRRFRKDSSCKVLIANPAAAREGLTLTEANNAIYLDRNFNLVDYLQSQDRIHRISQKKKCNIILLIGKNTVDEYIETSLYDKQNIAAFIQGDTLKTGEKKITKNELITLLEV